MHLCLLTDGLTHLELDEVLAWCAARELTAVELGVGGYSPAPHVDRAALLHDRRARAELLEKLEGAGVALAALNVSGNPLHPRREIAAAHDAALRDALKLAALLGCDRVVAMSGCPGGPGDVAWPVFAGGAWLPDMEGLWEWQWENVIAPYWRELAGFAHGEAPDVRICLELHPGASIYNPESFRLLAESADDAVMVNLDPSHFWWQGMDPIAVIDALDGAIGFAHGKDTLVHADRVARHGVLDFRWPADADTMPWHFCAVGDGHDTATWAELLGALRATGYDGAISIEHEDPRLDSETGIDVSLQGLRAALAALEQPA
ncbi:MAG TPA: sugar phosphate isomerase/epimerase [Solirubrobacteraceae bacterium]